MPKAIRKSSAVVGSAGGVSLISCAQTLPEPVDRWLVLATPLVSALLATYWPWFVDECAGIAKSFRTRRAIRNLEQYLERQQERLKDELLPGEVKELIRRRMEDVRRAITDKDFETVAEYL